MISLPIYDSKKNGFNIYSNKGELILEFTKQNCDSSLLNILDYIYETAKEFYDREKLKQNRIILNGPNGGFFSIKFKPIN